MGSISVVTGYLPPAFGYKAGGVIEVHSSAATDRWRVTGDVGVESFATAQGGVVAGGTLTPQLGLHLAGSSWRSDRLLDPVHPDNLLLNLFDRAYAYNFGNPFSGTHFGAPRTAAVSVEVTLR